MLINERVSPSSLNQRAHTEIQIRKRFERKMAIIFLRIRLNMCFGCLKEPSHRDGSFEYPQHMFWWRNKETIFPVRTLIWRLAHIPKIVTQLLSKNR